MLKQSTSSCTPRQQMIVLKAGFMLAQVVMGSGQVKVVSVGFFFVLVENTRNHNEHDGTSIDGQNCSKDFRSWEEKGHSGCSVAHLHQVGYRGLF